MNEKPVRIEEIDRRHKFRDEVPEKFLGGACFKFADFRYKTEKERIEVRSYQMNIKVIVLIVLL